MPDEILTLSGGDLIVDDYHLELRGLLHGPDTGLEIVELSGLDVPDVRTTDRDRPGRDGVEHGAFDLKRERRIVARIEISDEDDLTRWQRKGQLATAWDTERTDVVPLAIRVAGRTYLSYGRPRRCTWTDRGLTVAVFADVQFVAGDPRLYGDQLREVTLQLAETAGGFEFPLEFPLTFGAGGTSGVTQVVNAGNTATVPMVRIHGPVTSPRLEHLGRSETVAFAGTVPAGQHLDVDFDARTVLLSGTASRYEWFRGTWWDLDPGTNEIRFAAGSGSGGAVVTYRDAYTSPQP